MSFGGAQAKPAFPLSVVNARKGGAKIEPGFLNICIYLSRETQQIVVVDGAAYYRLWFGRFGSELWFSAVVQRCG